MTRDWRESGQKAEHLAEVRGGEWARSLPSDPGITHLELQVVWQRDYYRDRPRGFYFHVMAIGVRELSRTYAYGWPSERVLLEEGRRFSPKRLPELVDLVDAALASRQGAVWEAVRKVLLEGRLSLVEPVAVAA